MIELATFTSRVGPLDQCDIYIYAATSQTMQAGSAAGAHDDEAYRK